MTDVNRGFKSFQTFPEPRRGPCDVVRAMLHLQTVAAQRRIARQTRGPSTAEGLFASLVLIIWLKRARCEYGLDQGVRC